MNRFTPNQELRELVAQLCDGDFTPGQAARLEQLAIADPAARRYYITYLDLHGTLRRYLTAEIGADKAVPIHPPIISAECEPLDAIPPDPGYTLRFTAPIVELPKNGAAPTTTSTQNGWSNEAVASPGYLQAHPPILTSLRDFFLRGTGVMSRVAAAILIGSMCFAALVAVAVTMAVMKSQVQAGHVVSKSYFLGSRCVGRTERDMATGTVCFVRHPTTVSGRATSFSFYNVHADNDRWITPIILALDPTTSTYRITGIGQPVLNLGSGLQTVPFQLIAGSGDLQAGVHTFGFYHGTVDKTGKATSASLGPLDFDPLPESDDSVEERDGEARWLFVPWDATPVPLRLDLEFNLAPRPVQIAFLPGNETAPRERVYSGRLEITVEPEIPDTADVAGNSPIH